MLYNMRDVFNTDKWLQKLIDDLHQLSRCDNDDEIS